MRKNFSTFFFLVYSLAFISNLKASPENQTKVQAYKVKGSIKIDGKLNEKVWENPPVDHFIQKDPKEGETATEKTKVWIAYDDSYIYCAAKLYDSNPDSIRGRLARRDNFGDSDWFGVAFDSYHDRRTAFYFIVNPASSIEDGVFYNDSWSDNSWDGVWECATSIDSDGWNVEIAIPFSQLRFNKSDEMVWGASSYPYLVDAPDVFSQASTPSRLRLSPIRWCVVSTCNIRT